MSSIKKFFIPHSGYDYLVEADFSQLEIYVLAALSRCQNLKKDLLDGKDLHCMSASFLTGLSYEYLLERKIKSDPDVIAYRKRAKEISFQMQYGAGSRSIARTTGLDKKVVDKFIEAYYSRYEEVLEFQKEVIQIVKRTSIPSGKHSEKGLPTRVGFYTSPTGRIYTFYQYDSDYSPDGVDWSPTQMKNYPVQGTAADIVKLQLGELHKSVLGSSVKLLNCVHDSYLVECKKEHLSEVIHNFKCIFHSTLDNIQETFNWDFYNLPLKGEISSGSNWAEMKECT
jgi:DNA polymerase I-like protein with 3'-5' exonuclease and polymerase domains